MPSTRPSSSAAHAAAHHVRRLLPGPLGCLLGILLLPLVVLFFLLVMLANLFGLLRSPDARSDGGTRRSAAFEVALCNFVRAFSQDEDFGRDEALGAPLIATGEEIGNEDLLAEAAARGWIAQRGSRLQVTENGRRAAIEFLRERGL